MFFQKTIQFLLRLVRYAEDCGACEWELGCAVLTICRNLLLHHCSDYLYYGELFPSAVYLFCGEFCCITVHTTSTVVSPAVPLFTLPPQW